jgi:hypothetical protein
MKVMSHKLKINLKVSPRKHKNKVIQRGRKRKRIVRIILIPIILQLTTSARHAEVMFLVKRNIKTALNNTIKVR